jgi:hypothetical protein
MMDRGGADAARIFSQLLWKNCGNAAHSRGQSSVLLEDNSDCTRIRHGCIVIILNNLITD